MDIALSIAVTFLLTLVNGFFSMSEMALSTAKKVVLDHEGHPPAHYVPRRIDVVDHMTKLAHDGDLVITMGAGDVTALGDQLVSALEEMGR
jgi:UDP-N-acetylmuramate--alanine ligase